MKQSTSLFILAVIATSAQAGANSVDLGFSSNNVHAVIVITQDEVDPTCTDSRMPTYIAPYGCVRVRQDVHTESRWCREGSGSTNNREYRSVNRLRYQVVDGKGFGGATSYATVYEELTNPTAWDTSACGTRQPEPEPEPEPGPKPNPGDTFDFSVNLMCSSSDAGYSYMPPGNPDQQTCITNARKNAIISAYRNNGYGRCVERAGFEHWVWSILYHYSINEGATCVQAHNIMMNDLSKALKLEDGSWNCQTTADRLWPGLGVSAVMVPGSGKRCRVTN